jgi:hypothetical protein
MSVTEKALTLLLEPQEKLGELPALDEAVPVIHFPVRLLKSERLPKPLPAAQLKPEKLKSP